MNYYIQSLTITIWRKKIFLVLVTCLLVILIYGLQYSLSLQEKPTSKRDNLYDIAKKFNQDVSVKFLAQSLFFNSDDKKEESVHSKKLPIIENSTKQYTKQNKAAQNESRLLGIPTLNFNTQKPYIPKRRLVHLDLKGAPPVVSFYKKLFPMIKGMGATGILLEYEDMFPYSGILKNITATNAYTVTDIKYILMLAEKYNLEIVPLIQTFGHLEFALKHEEFVNLREVPESPQSICPSRENSLKLISEIIQQVMELHPKIKYLHIGCDEVYQMGECKVCRLELHENLFLHHVKNVADIIHDKYPKLKLIIWDDMLRHINKEAMLEISLGELIEPMIWVYAEEIYRFVQPQVWEKYTAVFKTAWTASAFKGAFGETSIVPNAKRHLENNLRWLEVMSQQSTIFKQGFEGIALTGWQRYDHFAVLCELLPASLPSLALNLMTVSHGYFNSSLKGNFLSVLSCPHSSDGHSTSFINLNADPYFWDKLGRCMFPGSSFFRLMYRFHMIEAEVVDYINLVRKQKGWMTEYNVRHNYSLPLRIDEIMSDLPRVYHGLISVARSAADAMVDIFDNYTISEWIEQKIYSYVLDLEKIQKDSTALKRANTWAVRPLSPLKDLQRLGIFIK